MHNIGGFKFENFSPSDDQVQDHETLSIRYNGCAKKTNFERSRRAIDVRLLTLCPLGATKVGRVLKMFQHAGAKCQFLRRGAFLVNTYIPQTTKASYIWSGEYLTNPFLLRGHYRYVVAIYLDAHYKVFGIDSGISTYEHFFF